MSRRSRNDNNSVQLIDNSAEMIDNLRQMIDNDFELIDNLWQMIDKFPMMLIGGYKAWAVLKTDFQGSPFSSFILV